MPATGRRPTQPPRSPNARDYAGLRFGGIGYWSLSAYLKYRVKGAVSFIGAFEEAVATEATRRGVDGVICGHIHHASDRVFAGIHYLNCGDWVESCTAVIETHEGELRVVHWKDRPLVHIVDVERDIAAMGPAPRRGRAV